MANTSGFWRPGDANPLASVSAYDVKANEQLASSSTIQFNPLHHLSLAQQRQALPVFHHRQQLLFCVENYQTTILVGETGSGKTTQVPQFLYEANWCNDHPSGTTSSSKRTSRRMIVCTQPRRIAAMTVAERVAQEMNTPLGKKVGYAVRFDEQWDPQETRIKFCTDGMLLRETMVDPLLSKYSVILLDEAHERNLETDLLLGLIKKIQRRRPELRVVVASATLQVDTFVRFFRHKKRKLPPSSDSSGAATTTDSTDSCKQLGDVVAISVEGRQYPVDVEYLKEPASDYLEKCIETALTVDLHEGPGDILMFLPGQEEIDFVVRSLSERAPPHLLPMPFYATLPFAMQQKVFLQAPPRTRKIIVATTIAETSVTLQGVSFVIDSCFTKLAFFNPLTGVESLVVTSISKASAKQRAGRAGRVAPGKCFRLCTESFFKEQLQEETIPQIQRTNLCPVALHLLSMGIHDLVHFDFVSPPSAEALARALETLFALGAINDKCQLSEPLGTQMAEFPLDPLLARMLLAAVECGKKWVLKDALTVASVLSVDDILLKPRGGQRSKERQQEMLQAQATLLDSRGDHLTLLRVYNEFQANSFSKSWCEDHFVSFRALTRAKETRKQLKRYLFRFGRVPGHALKSLEDDADDFEDEEDKTLLLKCVVTGFFANAARLDANGTYRTVRDGRLVQVHPTSVFYSHGRSPDWVLFHQSVLTTQEFVRHVSKIDPRWLVEVAPHFYRAKEVSHALSGSSGELGLPKAKAKAKPKPTPTVKPTTSNASQSDLNEEDDLDRGGRILFRKPVAKPRPKLPVHIGKSKGGLRSQF